MQRILEETIQRKKRSPHFLIKEVLGSYTHKDDTEKTFMLKWRENLRMRNYMSAIYSDIDKLEREDKLEQAMAS